VSKALRVLPLGGLGEIGKNMMVVEYDGRLVVVDTGLRFPTTDMLGIDLVLPDFTYLRERAQEIEAIVITHGHEDHVGALPWVLRQLGAARAPVVYGGRLTMAMARSKLDEHNLRDCALEDLAPGEDITVGPFNLELIHMTHSIPDSCAVAVSTELGTVLVTGDYKFDQTPVDGPPADVSRLAELGREGVLLLCGDSTNAEPRRGVRARGGTDHRHQLRLEHPPRPAGDRRRGLARAQGLAGRPLDAQERKHRTLVGAHRGPGGADDPAPGGRGLA
jgi:ribonuclease J